MAEAAGGREQPAAARAPPDAAYRAEEEPEPAALDAPAAAGGRRRERRSGVSAVGTAERFPGGSLGPAAAPDPDACLLEAAKATPRRSSIIKVRCAVPRRREVCSGPAGGFPRLKPPSVRPCPWEEAGWAEGWWELSGAGLRAPPRRWSGRSPVQRCCPACGEPGQRGRLPRAPGQGASPDRAALRRLCWGLLPPPRGRGPLRAPA